jgi:Nucleotidyl transferase AbiEii toxin, Type IV TA system
MAEAFLKLSTSDRREALAVAADRSGRPAHLLEKDVRGRLDTRDAVWVGPGEHLVFKGGTSLSKAYGVIRRFSEDVEKRWSKAVRHRLPEWIGGTVLPLAASAIDAQSLPASRRVKGEKLFVDYEATSAG